MHAHGRYLPRACTLNLTLTLTLTLTLFLRARSPLFISVIFRAGARIRYRPCAYNTVLAKPLATCTHLSSTVSQLFEPQVQIIAVFTYRIPHFCFPFPPETPLRLSRNVLHRWKDNSMLAKPLAACAYLSSIVSELYDA